MRDGEAALLYGVTQRQCTIQRVLYLRPDLNRPASPTPASFGLDGKARWSKGVRFDDDPRAQRREPPFRTPP